MDEQAQLSIDRKIVGQSHDYGIDVLKILSVLGVLVLHILGQDSSLLYDTQACLRYYVSWFMEIGAYCAVDTFAMITGYLMVNNKFKSGRLISLWVQAVFYALLFNMIGEIVTPGSIGLKKWLVSFFPVSGEIWWYFTSYFVLALFMPFINRMLHTLNKKQTIYLNIIMLSLFSVIGFVIQNDGFNLAGGYSPLWLTVCYIIGASVRKYNFMSNVNRKWCVLTYFLCVTLVWLSRVVISVITTWVLGEPFGVNVFVSYLSPLVVLMSLSLVLLFRNLQIPSIFCKLLRGGAAVSFAVYIIHTHPQICGYLFSEKLSILSELSAILLPVIVMLIAVAIFIGCSIIEGLRIRLFKYTRLTSLINKLGSSIDEKLSLDL